MTNQNNGVDNIASSTVAPPRAASGGSDTEALVESGWQHYSRKEYFRAESDFQKALEISPDNADTVYALAMNYMASARQREAIQAFGKVLAMLQNPPDNNYVRAHMLSRLAQGHINHMQTGDWNLAH